MGAKIECFLDCVSPYSYYAYLYLNKNRQALLSHGVEIDLIPFFLGGVNVGSGNKPPWTLPAKAKYGNFDSARAKKYFQAEKTKVPPFFPILSLLPQRCMVYVKDNFTTEKYEAGFQGLWVSMWEEGLDLSKPELMAESLARHFSEQEVKRILEATKTPEVKQKLLDNTQQALDKGAFGAPWFWVTNHAGKSEPFFGSDRFHFMWEFLGLPWKDIELKPKM